MSTWSGLFLPLLAVLVGLSGSRLADHLARRRRPGGDSGDYWVRVLFLSAGAMGVPVLLSTLLAPVLPAALWQSGWHLQPDRTGFLGSAPGSVYPLALLLPWALWGLFLVLGLAAKPGPRLEARSLAGGVGFRADRRWVLLCALPLAGVATVALPSLGGGPAAYPAITWSTLLLLALSLAGVAWSAGSTAAAAPSADPAADDGADDAPAPWPRVLAERGIRTTPVLSRRRHQVALAPETGTAAELGELLRRAGARGVAPELLRAAGTLLTPGGSDDGREALILAPGDCGQAEVVAATAEVVARRFLQSALVITARDAAGLANRLRPWLKRPGELSVVRTGDERLEGSIRVVEASVLSDHLLMRMATPGNPTGSELRRLGLVVWWNVDEYTGVLGANLWAISRRLYRLVRRAGREDDLRTLALARSRARGGEQLQRFVRRLLPQRFSDGAETHVPPRFPRPVEVHLLVADGGAPARPGAAQGHRPLALGAALASVEGGWRTHLEIPSDVARSEARGVLQLPVDGRTLEERLEDRPSQADAVIREVGADGVLALPERLAYGGREGPSHRTRHLGLLPTPNPYVRHLLEVRLPDDDPSGLPPRLLVCAEGHPSILQRHLLLALDEAPATLEDLERDFLFEAGLIRGILDELDGENKLDRKAVRYLRDDGSLGRSFEYSSYRPAVRQLRPLDTVGAELVEVRAPEEADSVPLRVDPERLTLVAYPQRIFHHRGKRYRIRDWNDVDRVRHRGWLHCKEEAAWGHTWRVPRSMLRRVRPDGPPVDVGRERLTLGRSTADVQYRERVSEVVELYRDGAGREQQRTHRFDALATQFETRALLLHLPPREDRRALRSLAQALRHVLPVHLGIGNDDMEVLPLDGEEVDGRTLHGVALVDLYPKGVGLVEAICDDAGFLLGLLDATREWLRRCPCAHDGGCPRCLASPTALAGGSRPSRSAALELLDEILTTA